MSKMVYTVHNVIQVVRRPYTMWKQLLCHYLNRRKIHTTFCNFFWFFAFVLGFIFESDVSVFHVWFPFRHDIANISDVAVIRIYHGQPETWLYKQTPAIQWFEIISKSSLCTLSLPKKKKFCFTICH